MPITEVKGLEVLGCKVFIDCPESNPEYADIFSDEMQILTQRRYFSLDAKSNARKERLAMNEIENYIPTVISDELGQTHYGKVLVELEKCHICHRYMINSRDAKYGLFPKYDKITIEKQMERAGWVQRSSVEVDEKYICCECAEAGKADFHCSLCNQRRLTDKIQESFGDPAEFLCTPCYESVPAKVWDEKVEKLREVHRYDFE
ncbi:MAG: hypothetical protein MUO85_02265 [candidate division Zixibacteria bacterium]|nr:hypothetical protein [candidate division Zixibacteria bacterium]